MAVRGGGGGGAGDRDGGTGGQGTHLHPTGSLPFSINDLMVLLNFNAFKHNKFNLEAPNFIKIEYLVART